MRSSRRPGGDAGTAAIEFAILTPVFLLMMSGIMAYGLYFGAANALQQLAADAARIAISGLSETERNRMVGAYLDRHARDTLLIDAQHLTYEIGIDPHDADQYRVRLHYDASRLPIWNLYPPLPLPSKIMVAGASIRRGGL